MAFVSSYPKDKFTILPTHHATNNPPTRTDTAARIWPNAGILRPIIAPDLEFELAATPAELAAAARADAVEEASFEASVPRYGNVVFVVVSRYNSVLGQC